MRSTSLTLVPLLAFGLTACVEGGANQGARQPGNTEGGIDVGLGEIAVAADGRYFLSESNGHLMVGDLETRSMRALDLPKADIIAFWPEGAGIYVITFPETFREGFTEAVWSYDLAEERMVWRRDLGRLDLNLDLSPDGGLVVWGWNGLRVLDAGTGEDRAAVDLEEGDHLHDLDVLADGRMVLTHRTQRDEEGQPATDVSMYASSGDDLCRITVPNCTSELVLNTAQTRAFLAPTRCGRDPVSVIELDAADCRFRENLPGFGPVAPSPDGSTMVAFMDRDDPDPAAPPRPDEVQQSEDRYHLMFIDAQTLAYDTTPIGDDLPRYTFTPDGRTLIIDNDEHQASRGVLLLDFATRATRTVRGPAVDLDRYVLTPDSTRAYLVDSGLYSLDVLEALVQSVPLSFVPMSINITPSGDTLLLKDRMDDRIVIFDVASEAETGDVPFI